MKTETPLIISLLAAGMLHLASCSTGGAENPSGPENATTPAEIALQTIEQKDVTREIEALGQVVFHEKVNISSRINGRLARVYVSEGCKVSKGMLLAEIERLQLELTLKEQSAELEIAGRALDLAQAKLDNAIRSVEVRFKSVEKACAELHDRETAFRNMERVLANKIALHGAGGISTNDLEAVKTEQTSSRSRFLQAKSDLEIQEVGLRDSDITGAGHPLPQNRGDKIRLIQIINTRIEKADLEAARAKVVQVEKSIEGTKTLIAETYIRSPLDGLVAAKQMETGEMVKQDSIIMTLITVSKVFVSLNVNESMAQSIRTGQKVTFTADALGATPFSGTVDRIIPVLDSKTRTLEIKALVHNSGMKLLPGMFVRAKIITGILKNSITVPLASILKREGDSGELYLVRENIAFRQPVTLGEEFSGMIEIKKGLSPGDRIISKGVALVYPEMQVITRNQVPGGR